MKHSDKRRSLKLTALFLTALTLLPMLFACGADPSAPAADVTAAPGAETTAAPEETTIPFEELPNDEKLQRTLQALPEADYGGYEFTFLAREVSNGLWSTQDVYTESMNGEPINDAVYARNGYLEDSFKIKIVEVRDTAPATKAKNTVLAGEDAYDVFNAGLNSINSMITEKQLVDFCTIPGIDLDNVWWDQNLASGLSIGGKLYYATGDISIMDNLGTWAITFNKDIIKSQNLDDPYQLVSDNKWLLSKMTEMAKAVASDLDGDGVMGDADLYGSCTESFNVYAYWVGSGQVICSKDEKDLPKLTMYNDRSASIIDQIMDFQCDRSVVTFTAGRKDGRYMYLVFRDGLALFTYGGMMTYAYYRDSEVDYGILPAPKFDEAQDDYYNTYSNSNFVTLSVPITASDLARTGTILEGWAALSRYTLSPAYYDITLSNKYLRDEESLDMIDLILNTRRYDLGQIFNWGSAFNLITDMFNAKSNDFASKYASNESKIQAKIDEFIEGIS